MKLSSFYEELAFFQHHENDVLSEFVDIAYEYLTNIKCKHKSYLNAALKLNTEYTEIEKLVETLATILLESVKLKTNKLEFISSLQPILINTSKILVIWEKIQLKQNSILELLSKSEINYTKFSSLNWRLDHTIASKSLSSNADTDFLIELNLKSRNGQQQIFFNTDIPNLFHMADVLERALNETKAAHIRKVVTNK